jgi:hypothetical protein
MIILFCIVALVVRWFDIKIVAWIKEENKKSHRVNSLLFDYLSNIRTLITLRFLKPTEVSLDHSIQDQKVPYMKHIIR